MNHPAIRKGCVAVITGAAAGIGFAIARRLCEEGMKIVLFDKDQAALDAAVSKLYQAVPGAQLLAVTGDVTSEQSLQELYDRAQGFGDVSLVVNNAAIAKGAGPWSNLGQWRQTMEVNFWSVLAIQQLFTEYLLSNGTPAAIVNLGSKEGITTPPGNAAYNVSKAALKVLTEQLAHELYQRSGNRVSAHLLIPGYTYTPMNFPEMAKSSAKPEAPWTADQVADRMVESMARGEFYLFCEDNEVTRELDQRRMQWSADDMIKNRPALSRWHPAYADQFRAYIADLK
ncbi:MULTISPECIES: SDR family NAD(P)-dependent oxidoreductase [Pseudomonas]|jgi:NAD(P)-dependent dehydrogenase (short-subunit alcohol dehydrogenase family)|uniref:SDR family NAD(P)-dependent oxidoreductase n=1 Tax=Pseudomonas TaxID=286 RepID=UPI0009537EFE|nr:MULTISPECIES: SDR family NAD(P)-dependent oxidoreductase [Pseudomonas]WLG65415.1 SDR family NAD(P)-dependent oxidoreductase [Pseudomonas brassicacearum]SIS02444.1 NAD(P)-dependent dehydrogenase, short-chain alcohol dehydrogenase family [Pseudomonas sp. A214]